jgi:hypothetical protein
MNIYVKSLILAGLLTTLVTGCQKQPQMADQKASDQQVQPGNPYNNPDRSNNETNQTDTDYCPTDDQNN